MISKDKIEEWIHEVEQRPISAPALLRYIANRLADLAAQNEELAAENLVLRSGERVEAYEKRIASLERQIELLRRNIGSADSSLEIADSPGESLLLFNTAGRIIRCALPTASHPVRFSAPIDLSRPTPGLLFLPAGEELLCVFSSGRTSSISLDRLPLQEDLLDWQAGTLAEPRGSEELSAILPIAKMPLYDLCVQVSRRACAKRMMRPALETHISREYIGSGVKSRTDRPAALTWGLKGQQLALATYEGYCCTFDVDQLPYTVEEVFQLSTSDHVIAAFISSGKSSILALTTSGKVLLRESSWLEPAASFKTGGQALFSPSRREAGTRLAGVAGVGEQDRLALLSTTGEVVVAPVSELAGAGSLPPPSGAEWLAITLLPPSTTQA